MIYAIKKTNAYAISKLLFEQTDALRYNEVTFWKH